MWICACNNYICKNGIVISTNHVLSEFQVSEHITAQTVNLVNRLVKNLKAHSSNQKVTFHPSLKFTHLHHKQMSTIILAFLTDCICYFVIQMSK